MNKHTAACTDSRDFARIARAIAFIDANFQAQPRLASIAAAAHLSEFHFNRLFRRWAGVTPRQYLAFVTARAARGALLGSRSVLDAALAVGLSGPGRLHDLMVTLEAATPGQLRAHGAGVVLSAGFAETPFGCTLLAATARGLAHLSFVEPGGEGAALAALAQQWPEAHVLRDEAAARQLAQRIWGAGNAHTELRLHVKGTNFQLKVWRALDRGGRARAHHLRGTGARGRQPGRGARRGCGGRCEPGRVADPLPQRAARGRAAGRLPLGYRAQAGDARLAGIGPPGAARGRSGRLPAGDITRTGLASLPCEPSRGEDCQLTATHVNYMI